MGKLLYNDWPTPRPVDWLQRVGAPQTAKELKALRTSVKRGSPYGDSAWQTKTARRLDLESSLRPRVGQKKDTTQ